MSLLGPWSPADGARVQLRMLHTLRQLVEIGRDAGLDARSWKLYTHKVQLELNLLDAKSAREGRKLFRDWCAAIGIDRSTVTEHSDQVGIRLVGAHKINGTEIVVVGEFHFADDEQAADSAGEAGAS